MALRTITRLSIPVAVGRGPGASLPAVSIRENGQIGFSKAASEAFTQFTHCLIQYDPETRVCTFLPMNPGKLAKGVKAEELFTVNESKKGKGSDRYMGLAGLFKEPDINYDYKAAGTHTYPAEVNPKTNAVSFTIPAVAPPMKPKTERKAKADKNGANGADSIKVTAADVAKGASAGAGMPTLEEAGA